VLLDEQLGEVVEAASMVEHRTCLGKKADRPFVQLDRLIGVAAELGDGRKRVEGFAARDDAAAFFG
jgi:hypothetical protein